MEFAHYKCFIIIIIIIIFIKSSRGRISIALQFKHDWKMPRTLKIKMSITEKYSG